MSGRVAILWDGFMRATKLDAPECPTIQRQEMEKAFYAGAAAMFYSLQKVVDPDDGEPTEREMMVMDTIDTELRAYFAEIDRARRTS